jgi:tetratricopeptide (TPR) repeat protein
MDKLKEALRMSLFALIERQRRTMERLLGFALSQKLYREAQGLIKPLYELWTARGLWLGKRRCVDRCWKALGVDDSTPPDLGSPAGSLWLFTVGEIASGAFNARHLDDAHATYDLIRRHLEASTTKSRDRHLANTYRHLGAVASIRGDLTTAEGWYRKSLEINEILGDQRGMAATYGLLGMQALLRGDFVAAEAWLRKSLVIAFLAILDGVRKRSRR